MGALGKLKSRMSGPGKTPFGRPTEPVSEQINNNASIDTSKGSSFPTGASDAVIQQWYANNSTGQQPTITQGHEDSLFTKLKTIVSNPFNSLKVALAPEEGAFESLQSLREYTQAANEGVKEAKNELASTKAFNTVSSFIPAAAAVDAVASAIEGDPTAIVTKKLNKIKPIAKGLTKIKLDPKKTSKVLSTGIKVAKKI